MDDPGLAIIVRRLQENSYDSGIVPSFAQRVAAPWRQKADRFWTGYRDGAEMFRILTDARTEDSHISIHGRLWNPVTLHDSLLSRDYERASARRAEWSSSGAYTIGFWWFTLFHPRLYGLERELRR